MLKRIITSLFCLFLIIVSTPICYADGVPSGYTPVTDNLELAQSFNDYCKSRDSEFTSTMPGASYTYIYNYMKDVAGKLGYNIDEIQEGLYKSYTDSGTIGKWYMTTQTIDFYNRLFAYFINENDLTVGDAADVDCYSGQYVSIGDYKCLAFLLNADPWNNATNTNLIRARGTYVKYFPSEIPSLYESGTTTLTVEGDGYTVSQPVYRYSSGGKYWYSWSNSISSPQMNNSFYCNNVQSGSNVVNAYGGFAVAYYNGNYSLGLLGDGDITYSGGNSTHMAGWIRLRYLGALDSQQAGAVNINFVSNTINNNNYEGDTIINNNGDVITDDPEPTPGGQDPGWDVGGGQGSYEDNNGNSYTINFPDFELPDLNINWSIQGLGNKFPFSIPFDIASLVSVLNAEPEAPRFEGTVNFGFTTWDYDINLEQFDSVAHACRIAELLLLVFGLILITRSIIKG